MKIKLQDKLKQAALTKRERIIADTLTKNLHKNAFLNGPQLAETCRVAPSSITRFAQKLGYSGFPELKRELETLYRKTTTPHEVFQDFISQKSQKDVADATIEQDIQNIMNVHTYLNKETLSKVVKLINNARKIIIASIGTSEVCVDIFHYYFEALGKDYIKLKGFGISKQIEVMVIDPDDVVIVISFQKILKEVRDVALFAHEKGAATIAITDSEFSPLAMACDHVLVTPVIGTTFSLSQAAPVVMVNIIVNRLAALDKEKSLELLKNTKKEWEEFPIFCE